MVDSIEGDYELLALSFNGQKPHFNENAKKMKIKEKELTVYYGIQCPYTANCIEQVENYCHQNNIPLNLYQVDTLDKAKNVPCVFSNWAVFYNGDFKTTHLLNEKYLKKLFDL